MTSNQVRPGDIVGTESPITTDYRSRAALAAFRVELSSPPGSPPSTATAPKSRHFRTVNSVISLEQMGMTLQEDAQSLEGPSEHRPAGEAWSPLAS